MKRTALLVIFCVALMAGQGEAVQWSELSKLAQAIVPAGKGVILHLKDGKTAEGLVTQEDDQKMVLKVQKGGISAGRTILKSDIVKTETLDVAPMFAAKLKEIELDPKNSLQEQSYVKAILLFAEFMEKCKGAEDYDVIAEKLVDFAAEYRKLKRGMEKMDGEWLTPVRATVRKFDDCSLRIKEMEKKPEVMASAKGKEEYQRMVEERRKAVRQLPETMKDRVPQMIEGKQFDDAVAETVAFLQFWIGQVFRSEGAAAHVFKQMDFDYILRMQMQVMDAYTKSGGGKEKNETVTVPQDMVFVPGGYFLMGKRNAGPEDDGFPMHLVYVSPFLLDKYEVSNRDYSNFVAKVRDKPDPAIEHAMAPPLKKHDAAGWQDEGLSGPDQPVVGVDWFDAYAYAKHVGKRLPTEAEWEKAAAGIESRTYPWGDGDASTSGVNWTEGRSYIAAEMDRQNPPRAPEPAKGSGCSCGGSKKAKQMAVPQPTRIPERTWDVKAKLPAKAAKARDDEFFEWTQEYPGPYGAIHMGGNAAEWVYDWYDTTYYGQSAVSDPQGPSEGKVHVVRGGSFISKDKTELMTRTRLFPGKTFRENGCTSEGKAVVGFRCARSLDIVKKPGEEDGLDKVDVEQLLKEIRSSQVSEPAKVPAPEKPAAPAKEVKARDAKAPVRGSGGTTPAAAGR